MLEQSPYELTIDLNTLNHLGIGLYSNIPAVISEVVANSYDADASQVEIKIDKKHHTITITDDGWGMTKADINQRYLTVGYNKRQHEAPVTPKGRLPMGRKGIGKLSLFSIANTIEVHSVKRDAQGVLQKNGFVMNAENIKATIESGTPPYRPNPVPESRITIAQGTMITLRDLKLGVASTEAFLRKRLARRFSVIGAERKFAVIVNTEPITIKDRDYFGKLDYLWCIGEASEKYYEYCPSCRRHKEVSGVVDEERGYSVSGWVGTFNEQKSIEEGDNTIIVLARGKLVHEDLLKDLKEAGIYATYLIGELDADFLDVDEEDDITTSDRQSLKETDPRFRKLKEFVQKEILKQIQKNWTDWRNADAEKKAREDPRIDKWFGGLSEDDLRLARSLFGTIDKFSIARPEHKKILYQHAILGFQTLALKRNLGLLDRITTERDFELFRSLFAGIDQIEAIRYYQILKGRLDVIKKFENLVDDNARERVVQTHIFDHLWLLDPSWERASTDERIEESVTKEFKKVTDKLTPEERAARIDIRYRTAAGKHIIVELKRYGRSANAIQLLGQVRKYRGALEKCLEKVYPERLPPIEVICIVGQKPDGDDAENKRLLDALGARYITYDSLIQQTRESYRDYLEANKEIGELEDLITSIGQDSRAE